MDSDAGLDRSTARIELKQNDVMIETITLPINLVPLPSAVWRADFDLSAGAVGPYVCLRNQYWWTNTGSVDFDVEIYDPFGDTLVGQESYAGFSNGNLSDEIFLSGTALASGQGYMEITFSSPILLNDVEVEGRTGQSINGGVTGFFDAQLTPLP